MNIKTLGCDNSGHEVRGLADEAPLNNDSVRIKHRGKYL